jgi:hypothetical protein
MACGYDLDAILACLALDGTVTIPSASLAACDRRSLTLELDRRGFVAAKAKQTGPQEREQEVLHLTKSLNAHCDLDALDSEQLRYFSELLGVSLNDPCSVRGDLVLLGYANTTLLEDLTEELFRYGVENLVRRDRIMEHALIEQLSVELAALVLPDSHVPKELVTKTNVYKERNTKDPNACFVSVDLRAAVFHCYHQLAQEQQPQSLLAKADTWADYVRNFTSSKTLALNKDLRLRVFGKAKPPDFKPEILWQNQLYLLFVQMSGRLQGFDSLVVFGNDEFVFETTPHALSEQKHLFAKMKEEPVSVPFRIQAFRLHALARPAHLPPSKKNKRERTWAFVREDLDLETSKPSGRFDVKCVPREQKMQALRAAQAFLA